MSASWAPYPPCQSGTCSDQGCCAEGYKFRWPELVGKSEQVARAVIERDNPLVTVVPLPDGVVGYTDFCCNRVYIFLDSDGNVRSTPVVG